MERAKILVMKHPWIAVAVAIIMFRIVAGFWIAPPLLLPKATEAPEHQPYQKYGPDDAIPI